MLIFLFMGWLGLKNILVLIPCYNEEKGIGNVIDAILTSQSRLGCKVSVAIIDNNCSDKTVKIAKQKGVRIIRERRQGKGYAIMKGFYALPKDVDIIVMIDGDNTYDAGELPRLIEPLLNGFCDVVTGSRLHGRLDVNSMNGLNRVGNWFLTFLVRVGYKTNITDVCSGFFAWKKDVILKLRPHLISGSFSIEMEMVTKLAKLNIDCYSVPVTYRHREGNSKLRPLKDGLSIIYVWSRNLLWKPSKT